MCAGVPLVNYHRHGSLFQNALKSKGSFFQAIESGDSTSEDLVQSMLYRSISNFFEHSKDKCIKTFLSPSFWEQEDEATATMEQVISSTNHKVSATFLRISVCTLPETHSIRYRRNFADFFC